MLNLDSIDSREDFKWDLITRAHKEPEFRAVLRMEPQTALRRALGGDAVPGLTLAPHQENAAEIFCLINYNPDLPGKADSIRISPEDNHEAVLVKKAWKDPAYRKELLANPARKFQDEFGAPMPPGIALRVLEESRDTLHLILPASLAEQDIAAAGRSELTDAELEGVAGGGILGSISDWITAKMAEFKEFNTSGEVSTGSCGCNSASGVRG